MDRVPFHQVKGGNYKMKVPQSAGYGDFPGTRTRAEQKQQWAKSNTLWDRNGRRGSYTQKAAPEISREFRVVRDNRINQNTAPESVQKLSEDNHELTSNVPEKSSIGNLIENKHSAVRNSDGCGLCQNLNGRCDSGLGHSKDEKSTGNVKASLPKEKKITASNSTGVVPTEVKIDSQAHYQMDASANSVVEAYASSSDPVRTPSIGSSGIAVAVQHEVGKHGGQCQPSHYSNSSNSFSIPLSERGTSSSRHTTTLSSNHLNPSSGLKPVIASMSASSSFATSQYQAKLPQQVMGHHKGTQPNMAWKPKSSRKPNAESHPVTTHTNQDHIAGLSEKITRVNLPKIEHVIIPQCLRVSESERARLMFGSFGASFDSSKGFTSALEAFKNAEESTSIYASNSVAFVEDSGANQSTPVDLHVSTSQSDDSTLVAKPELPLPANDESLSPRDIESYPDIGLIQSHKPSFSSPEPQQQKSLPRFSVFSAYEPQMKFDIPFSKMTIDDNSQGQDLLNAHEAIGSVSMVPMFQQQQQFTQLSPQAISHYANFDPYHRPILSPLYDPQMLMPNYSNNSVHNNYHSNGSNYIIMQGGNSQLTSGSMKYGTPHYKPVQAGGPTDAHGTYTNPEEYTIGAIGSIAGMDDVTRMNFEDSNVYVPNPQLDADVWMQTPKELPRLQPTPCYNSSGQVTVNPAYVPANLASNQTTFPSPHLQYTGFYNHHYPSQTTNHVVHHQQVQSMVPSAAAQVQLGHLGWNSNF